MILNHATTAEFSHLELELVCSMMNCKYDKSKPGVLGSTIHLLLPHGTLVLILLLDTGRKQEVFGQGPICLTMELTASQIYLELPQNKFNL